MKLLRARRDFDATVDAAAGQRGISAVIIEKDYWVSQVLRTLASDFPGDFIFKGGTSLSKCYRMIDRFSEDVDILVVPSGRGGGAIDKLMKEMASAACAALGATPGGGRSSRGESRTVHVPYPTRRPLAQGISPAVVLEMGIRGGDQPSEMLEAGCLLADILTQAGQEITAYEDLQAVLLPVLHPGRTLLEKLAVVHTSLGGEPAEAECQKHGRHYYDIYQLLGDDRVASLLRDRPQVEEVVGSIQAITDRYFTKPGEPRKMVRPAAGWASSAAFDPSNVRLGEGYARSMKVLSLAPGKYPRFSEVCLRVAEWADLL